MSEEEDYEDVPWIDPKVTWLKRIKDTKTLKCLRCGGTSHVAKAIHFYYGHKDCVL